MAAIKCFSQERLESGFSMHVPFYTCLVFRGKNAGSRQKKYGCRSSSYAIQSKLRLLWSACVQVPMTMSLQMYDTLHAHVEQRACLREVPVVERDDRLDVGSEQRIHQVAVKGQAGRVNVAASAGNHTCPGHREAEVADAKALHECDIFRVPMVKIIRDVCCTFSETPSQPAVSYLDVTANQQ